MFIYTIKCKTNDKLIYIGSTVQELHKRWATHKMNSSVKQTPLYQSIRNNGGIENHQIEVLDEFQGTIRELRRKEGEFIKDFKGKPEYTVLNHNIAGRELKEYYQDNREILKKSQLDYYYKNKERRIEYQKKYDQENKNQISIKKKNAYQLKKQLNQNKKMI